MGATDNSNQLRSLATIDRPGQVKWTKKFISFLVDICAGNAYKVWKTNALNKAKKKHERALFLEQLIEGLIHDREIVHTPIQASTRKHCRWKGCQATTSPQRQALAEISNYSRKSYTSKTTNYCKSCGIHLCVSKGCWAAHHAQYELPVAEQEDQRVEGVGSQA